MWFYRKAKENQKTEEVLKPGICECLHARCSHVNGKGKCNAQHPPDKETNYWTECACQLYIPDDDGGGDDHPEVPIDPEVAELERIARMK